MKTKIKTKKPLAKKLAKTKKSKLTPTEKILFRQNLLNFFLWVDNNGDLIDPYVLEVDDFSKDSEFDIPRTNLKLDKTSSQPSKLIAIFNDRFKKRLKLIFIILLVVVGIQIIYPKNYSTPMTRLDGLGFIGPSDQQKILNKYNDFDQRIVTVHTHTKNITTSYKDLGVTINPVATATQVVDYPFFKRLIPFSILDANSYQIERDINDSQLKIFVDDVVALASKKPVDALVTFKDAKFNISPSEEGYEYKQSELKSVLLGTNLDGNAQLVFAPTVLYPNISSDVAASNVTPMQARVQTALTIIADGKEFIIKPSKMQSWVYISHRPEQKTVEIGFDQRKIADSLRFLSAEIDYSVINTVTTLLNGIRAGHKEGTSGRSLRFDELVKTVAQTTSPATTSIEASVKTISPVEVIDRTYSRDSAGAQSLLDYWVGARSGQFGIDFRTVDGRISANINPNQIFSSVGVYRTYLASLVYNKLAAGSIYNSSQVNNGNTVRNCLSKMIIESDQSCTNALGDLVGWSASDSLLGSQGFESTTLTQNSSLSTANDSADWMIKLLSGGITQFSQANELTNLMSQQQYNSGMTAGSSGIRVADKTGVYGRNVNDVGIVYHPNGTYVLSVYSEGSSLSAIAELTRELNRLMSQ